MEEDPLSPPERELWNEARDLLAHELGVQVAIGRLASDDGSRDTAGILLDELWRRYELRRRPVRLGRS